MELWLYNTNHTGVLNVRFERVLRGRRRRRGRHCHAAARLGQLGLGVALQLLRARQPRREGSVARLGLGRAKGNVALRKTCASVCVGV